MDIDGEKRVKTDLQIECGKGPHFFWAFLVAMPALIVWGLGIPFFAIQLLRKEKYHLDTPAIREKFGFLFRGFKKDYYYWECVIMYRKIILIFIAVFLVNFGVITQALVVFLLLIGFVMFNVKKKPFSTEPLNNLETMSLVTSMITVYCGLFFISDMPEIYNSADPELQQASNGLELNEGTKIIFFFVIVVVNLLFFGYWSYKMYLEIKLVLLKKFSKVYLILCVCMNEEQLKHDKERMRVEEEHEILRESYMKTLSKVKKLYQSGAVILNEKSLERFQHYLLPEKILTAMGQKAVEREMTERHKQRMNREDYNKDFKRNPKMYQGHDIRETDDDSIDFQKKNRSKTEMLRIDQDERLADPDASIMQDQKRPLHVRNKRNYTDDSSQLEINIEEQIWPEEEVKEVSASDGFNTGRGLLNTYRKIQIKGLNFDSDALSVPNQPSPAVRQGGDSSKNANERASSPGMFPSI